MHFKCRYGYTEKDLATELEKFKLLCDELKPDGKRNDEQSQLGNAGNGSNSSSTSCSGRIVELADDEEEKAEVAKAKGKELA